MVFEELDEAARGGRGGLERLDRNADAHDDGDLERYGFYLLLVSGERERRQDRHAQAARDHG